MPTKSTETKAKVVTTKVEEPKVEAKPKVTASKTKVTTVKAEVKKEEKKPAVKAEAKPAAKKTATKKEVKPTVKAEVKKEEKKAEAKPAAKKTTVKKEAAKPAAKKTATKKAETKPVEKKPVAKKAATKKEEVKPVAKKATAKKAAPKKTATKKEVVKEEPVVDYGPRKSVAFIGSECFPFVKTGGLGDVMYALPKELAKQNCDVKVILPRYACIKQEWQEKMEYRGSFDMDLCADGTSYYVGIMEYAADGVVYDFIDNEYFFTSGNPYTTIVDDIPKYCYFAKAALAALNYLDWTPDVIHCHDWQAALVPVFKDALFGNTPLARSKTVITIHNLRFQGIYDIQTLRYWTGLPEDVLVNSVMDGQDGNMLKGGLTYANMITTVSETYAGEIQTGFYGEHLDGHLRYHSGKLRGIVNGIDVDQWNPDTDKLIYKNYNVKNVIKNKKANKKALQEELGLEVDDSKFVIGLISRLTDQKGLDLINAIIPDLMDGNTQIAVLGTGEPKYEDSFRYYEGAYHGQICSSIMYDEGRSHKIYASVDALLVPSLFEPCGLTQLNAMRYGTIPVVRETGGLKDTVEPYNQYENTGNGFTFDNYDAGLLLDAINRAKTVYFTDREKYDEMIVRDMNKDVSWANSAKKYKDMYLELTY